jgi:hypothetical protein
MSSAKKTLEDLLAEGYEKVEVKASELMQGDWFVVGSKPFVYLDEEEFRHDFTCLIETCGCPVYRKKAQKPLVWEGRITVSQGGGGPCYIGCFDGALLDFIGKTVRITEVSNEDSTPKSSPVWRGIVDCIGGVFYPRGNSFPNFKGVDVEIYLAGEGR